MSDQPQPPIQQLLDVPDLVWNVFKRLEPASRQAFFQAHRDVPQNGHVLAHTKLHIELRPESLEDQWQRVLRLTRSQPPRCLIIAGPRKQRLKDFLCCVPEGRHEEKQKVLQGAELQLQVYIKLETGGASRLQDLMRSWNNEQKSGDEDARVQLVLDLCGRELTFTTESVLGILEPPSCCTLRNGTLQLQDKFCVRVSKDRVRFESIRVQAGEQGVVVEVVSGGRLEMEGCRVEGGSRCFSDYEGAVWVGGAGSSLCAQRCSMQSKGSGLVVSEGGRAVLESVTASSCGQNGVFMTEEGSTLNAAHCRMDGNVCYNVYVCSCAHCCLRHCSCTGSGDHGWTVCDRNSRLVASDSSTSSNKRHGVSVCNGASASLSACSVQYNATGLHVEDPGSVLEAQACLVQCNREGNTRELRNGCISCLDE